MGLKRLAISNPGANTDTTLYTANDQYLVSVIASNKSTTNSANVRIWVQPSGSSGPSQYAYINYDVPVDPSNAFETFRFAVNQNDVIKVRSNTADISFSAYGLVQFDINLGLGIVSYSATAPTDTVDGLIWVDSDGVITGNPNVKPAYIWSATANNWIDFAGVSNNGVTVCTSSTHPSSPYEGQIIYETDTDRIYSYDGSVWKQVGGVVICTSMTRPLPYTEGQVIYETDTDRIMVYDGFYWKQLGIGVCTSSTRPSPATEGMVIYETDTDKIMSFDGSNWKQVGGVVVCTSSTRPSPATEGMMVYETDTDRVLAYDGSSWVGINGVVYYQTSAPSNPVTGTVWVDSDDIGATLNSSDFALKTDVPLYAATGAGSDHVFFENGQTINTSYTITTNKNALSAGPVTISNNVTVTIPSGSSWVIL